MHLPNEESLRVSALGVNGKQEYRAKRSELNPLPDAGVLNPVTCRSRCR